MKKGMRRLAAVGAVAMVAALVPAAPGHTGGAQVTQGRFNVFAAGVGNAAYDDLEGHAQMVRTADGRTIVTTSLKGLAPSTTYGSHVHAAACGVGAANGHYKHDPAGPGTPPNEIWPGFTTNDAGNGSGKDTAGWTAGSTAVSVVVHAPGGAKIACADLA